MKRREGYLFKDGFYSRRREFFSHADHSTTKPSFFSEVPKNESPLQSLQSSISRFLKKRESLQGTPIYILYSGGIDSEIVLLTALKMGLPVIPVVVDLFGMNAYELGFARSFFREYGITKFNWLEVAESEFQRRWLPELIADTESLSYLLSGAYIAARSCPEKATVIQSGENPNVLYFKNGSVFQMRHEYSFWSQKVNQARGLNVFDIYSDPDVLRSYIHQPAIIERLSSPVPYDEWSCDNEYLGKEYLYNDPDFRNLKRRYSQHGWEARKGAQGYTKDMVPFVNPYSEVGSKQNKAYITDEMALPFLLKSLTSDALDPDEGYEMIFKGKGNSIPELFKSTRSKDFNRIFYSFLGTLKAGAVISDRSSTAITSHSGELVSH